MQATTEKVPPRSTLSPRTAMSSLLSVAGTYSTTGGLMSRSLVRANAQRPKALSQLPHPSGLVLVGIELKEHTPCRRGLGHGNGKSVKAGPTTCRRSPGGNGAAAGLRNRSLCGGRWNDASITAISAVLFSAHLFFPRKIRLGFVSS
jgi:hypothetical protein